MKKLSKLLAGFLAALLAVVSLIPMVTINAKAEGERAKLIVRVENVDGNTYKTGTTYAGAVVTITDSDHIYSTSAGNGWIVDDAVDSLLIGDTVSFTVDYTNATFGEGMVGVFAEYDAANDRYNILNGEKIADNVYSYTYTVNMADTNLAVLSTEASSESGNTPGAATKPELKKTDKPILFFMESGDITDGAKALNLQGAKVTILNDDVHFALVGGKSSYIAFIDAGTVLHFAIDSKGYGIEEGSTFGFGMEFPQDNYIDLITPTKIVGDTFYYDLKVDNFEYNMCICSIGNVLYEDLRVEETEEKTEENTEEKTEETTTEVVTKTPTAEENTANVTVSYKSSLVIKSADGTVSGEPTLVFAKADENKVDFGVVPVAKEEIGVIESFDITCLIGETGTKVTNTSEKISVTVSVSADDIKDKDVAIAREHEGKTDIIVPDKVEGGNITFSTDKFSVYSVITLPAGTLKAMADKNNNNNNNSNNSSATTTENTGVLDVVPKTGQSIPFVLIGLTVISLIGCVTLKGVRHH